jgi:arsenate reductase
MNFKILILCTGNSCRSQMAQGILRNLDNELQVSSAGTKPASKVNPYAIKVMKEIGIDITKQYPKDVKQFLNQPFDYLITVCDNANQTCPVFYGQVKHRLHHSITDPAEAAGTEEEVLPVYRKVRDQIKEIFTDFYHNLSP